MTPQASFMVVDRVSEDHLERLRVLLASMNAGDGRADPANVLIPFGQFATLHTARLLMLVAGTGDEIRAYGHEPRPWPISLVLLGDIDGDRDAFLAELAVRARPGLERLFDCCENFRGHRGTLLEWLRSHSVGSAAHYVNWQGRTVRQISEDAALSRVLGAALPGALARAGRKDARAVRRALLEQVERERHAGRLELTPPAPTPLGWRLRNTLHLLGIPLLLLVLAPLLLIASPAIAWRLRSLEKTDPAIEDRPTRAHVAMLAQSEDIDVTNQFNVFGDVKPGTFRRMALRLALLLVDYGARHVYRRGSLARVRTIHFARWVWLDDRRRLLFASQYDGSLESYMDDFINKVSFGLNLVFSHGVGYPRTRWVIKGGAEHEQAFKDTLRRHQLPSAVWYRAHPGLTAQDMARNAALREGVERRPPTRAAVRGWLSKI